MKVLVTGANGYLGLGVARTILNMGHEVIAADFHTNNVDDRAKKYSCNLFEIEDPYVFFEKPDVLLHLAWRDGFVHYSENHIGDLPQHVNFIKKISLSRIKTISVMGTMHEIGFYEGSIDESTPCNPESYYGIAKNALRDVTRLICKQNNINFQWLRGYYIVGNSEFGSSIFSKITTAVKEGKTEFPFTMGENQFDFIEYEDFCKQVAITSTQDEINGIINICSGHPEKLSDRVERFIRDNKYNIRLLYGAFPDRPYDSKAVWGNDTKIKRIMENHDMKSILTD